VNAFDQCAYPPRLAPDVEIAARNESSTQSFIAGSASVGRYLMLGAIEHQVLELLDGERPAKAICEELARLNGSAPSVASLSGFLAKLDEVGILAGERAGRNQQALLPGSQLYLRWSLFNPDHLFARWLPALRWIWTTWFFCASVALMAVASAAALLDWAEVSRYAANALREHCFAVFVAAWLVTIAHEFAHGMTAKAFGGRATEVGGLLVYYCFPALYCNVSGLHMIPQRGRRMWVIAAGIYFQLLVGAGAMLFWFVFQPDTIVAGAAMALALGSLLDLVFNANPLIKLDGYYFLSQWLRIPNLMDRSRARWRMLLGAREPNGVEFSPRDSRILLLFGFFSFFYGLAFPAAIAWYAAQYLMDRFGFSGLILTILLVLAYCWEPIKRIVIRKGGHMATTASKNRDWRRFVPAAIGMVVLMALSMPWTASVGSYGALVAIPGREAIVRAPENASLVALNVQPGQSVSRGLAIARLGNRDVEEQIAQIRTDLARVNGDADRLSGEILVQQQAAATSEWQLAQRHRELNDINSEEQQIQSRAPSRSSADFIPASTSAPGGQLPASLAVFEVNIQQLRSRLAEADRECDRARQLFKAGLIAGAKLDTAEASRSSIAFDLTAAVDRLNGALIEHRRRRAGIETDMNVASSQLAAGRAQSTNLGLQLDAARRLRTSLEERLALLEAKRALLALSAPVSGTLFGDDLPRMLGQYFARGTEICRIADTRELLVRVQVPEQEVGDVAIGQTVRVKARAFPDRIFQGVVSKIGGESEMDGNGQRSYRVELTIQNDEGQLKPGMTVFARVNFGRRMVAWLIGHKLKQALRPEVWML